MTFDVSGCHRDDSDDRDDRDTLAHPYTTRSHQTEHWTEQYRCLGVKHNNRRDTACHAGT